MKNYLFLIFILFLFSCKTSDKLNLEELNFDFSIEEFYSEDIEKQKLFFTENRKGLEFRIIEIDSVYKFDYDEKLNKLIGIQYNMKSRIVGKNTAYYNDMYFETMNTMKSETGDFMALVASNESEKTKEVENLLDYLTSKYGKPKIHESDFFGKYFTYNWNIEDRMIIVGSIFDNRENTIQIKINIPKEKIEIDNTKKAKYVTKFFIVNQKYKDFIKEELNHRSGDWVYLKYK